MGRSSTKIGLLCLWVLLESQVALCAGPQPPVDKHKDYFASQCAEEKHESPAGHGLKYWVYIPNRLRHGTSAPVVVFLHGFGSQDPRYYLLHIRHLCLQGNVVIFPQFLATSLGGKIEDQLLNADQHKFLARAIHAVEEALSDLGTQTNGEDITIYGHSLGGVLALALSEQSFSPTRLVLANPATTAPEFVKKLSKYTPIDWRQAAAAVSCPVWILTGDDDTVAPSDQAIAIYDALANASMRAVYMVHSDALGSPPLKADHDAPKTVRGSLPITRMVLTGKAGQVDAINTRFYWPALDAAVAGDKEISFDMGTWSNGVPVHPVTKLR